MLLFETNYEIKHEVNYFVVYINGLFYCTTDTYKEAVEEIQNYQKELKGDNKNE